MKRPCSSRLRERAVEPRLAGRGLGSTDQRGDPVRGADRDVHRARPVRPELDRVARDPRAQLRADLVEVARVAGQPVRGRQQRQVLEARELPRHLDVGAVAEDDRDLRDVTERPAAARLEVARASRSRGRARPGRSRAGRSGGGDRRRRARAARPARPPRSGSRSSRRGDGRQRRRAPVRAARRPRWRPRARGAAARALTRGGRSAACARRGRHAHDRACRRAAAARVPRHGPSRRHAAKPSRSARHVTRARARRPSGRARR